MLEFSSQLQRSIEKNFKRSFPAETFPWTPINQIDKSVDIIVREGVYLDALGTELAEKSVRIFVGSPFPRSMRLRKIKWGSPVRFATEARAANSLPRSGVMLRRSSEESFSNMATISSSTSLAAFLGAFFPRKKRDLRSASVIQHAPPAFPTTVSASQRPISDLAFASAGRSSRGWLIGILPRRSSSPL